MELVKRINKFLKDYYGLSHDNKPRFRVVWSEDLFETRKGQFSEHIIYEEIKKAPKYMAVTDRWILEVYTNAYPEIFRSALKDKQNIVMEGDGYEPLRVFMTKKGDYLKPDQEICKIICDRWADLVNRPEAKRLTEKMASYADAQKMKKEVAQFYEILAGNDSDLLSGRFTDGEAVIIHREEV